MPLRSRRLDDNAPRRRLREQPISRIFPNMVTLAGLCCGLSAIRYAMIGRWEIAAAFIVAAALIDGMDGRIARMLGATSAFGAQLDSLVDFVCFGVVPVLVIYMWSLQDIRGIGWAAVLFFVVCAALRLARFNTGLGVDTKEPWEKLFSVGVPSPSGGGLCIIPLFIEIQFGYTLPAPVVAIYTVLIGALMSSRIPTYSGKGVRIKHELIPAFLVGCSLFLVMFIIEPWIMLMLSGFVYLAMIPVSTRHWMRLKAKSRAESEMAPAA